MTRIHGMAYIIIGIVILLVSWFVRKEKLVVFIYASFIMIAMGVVKLAFSGKKEKRDSRNESGRDIRDINTAQERKPVHPSTTSHSHPSKQRGINKNFNKTFAAKSSPEIRKCLRCTNILNDNDRFCSRCGARAVR